MKMSQKGSYRSGQLWSCWLGLVGSLRTKWKKGVVTVQTGQVVRQDVTSVVTASGEIRPQNYTNVVGQGIGLITDIVVKEGDHVKKGDVLLHVESIQPGADVQAQSASIASAADAAMKAAAASYDSAVATLAQRQADLDKAKLDWDRSDQLYKSQLISKQDYDASKATYTSAAAGLKASEAQVAQINASREQAGSLLDQNRAQLKHLQDVLRKTTYTAPIDGIVSYVCGAGGRKCGSWHSELPGQFPAHDFGHELGHFRSESG